MKLSPSVIGARAELAVAVALSEAGMAVYVPLFNAHSRIDLVFEDEAGLHRLQCKTSRIVKGVLCFSTCSNSKGERRDYRGEIDVFGVHSPDLEQVFLVPVEEVPRRACSLRLNAAANGQQKGLRWARDYLLDRPT